MGMVGSAKHPDWGEASWSSDVLAKSRRAGCDGFGVESQRHSRRQKRSTLATRCYRVSIRMADQMGANFLPFSPI